MSVLVVVVIVVIVTGTRLYKFLLSGIGINKLPLADMLMLTRCPYIAAAGKTAALLPFNMGIGTCSIHAGSVLARDPLVCIFAIRVFAIATVAAEWHVRVIEVTLRVRTFREEAAKFC